MTWGDQWERNTTTLPPSPPSVAAPAAVSFWSSVWVMAVLAAAGLFGLVLSIILYEVKMRARWAREDARDAAAARPAASAAPVGASGQAPQRRRLGVLLREEDARASEPCPICLEQLHGGECVSALRCEHRFHHACLEAWLESGARQVCPLCIRPVDVEHTLAAVVGPHELEIVSL
jgi:hypothetical protein